MVQKSQNVITIAFSRPYRTNTKKKDVLFIIGDWNAQVGTQEIPGVTGKFGLGVQKEAGQRLTAFCQENALANLIYIYNDYYNRANLFIISYSHHCVCVCVCVW